MSSRSIADRTFFPDPVLASGSAGSWPAPSSFGQPGDRIVVDWGTADVVLARYCGMGLSGTLRIDGEPGVRIYLHDGLVYFAEHTTDTELGFRLVLDGLITEDQLVRGSRLLERGRHLGQMFWNDPSIDSGLVVDAVVGYCTDTVHSLTGLPVTAHAFLADEHHSSGILAWYTGSSEVALALPVEVEAVEAVVFEAVELVELEVDEAVEAEPVEIEVLETVELEVVELELPAAVEVVELEVLAAVDVETVEVVELEVLAVDVEEFDEVDVEVEEFDEVDEVDDVEVLAAVVVEPVVIELVDLDEVEVEVVAPVELEVEPVHLEAVDVDDVSTPDPPDELERVFTTMLDWLGPVELEPLVDFDDDYRLPELEPLDFDDYRMPVVVVPRLPRRSRHDEPMTVSANLDNSGMGSVDISVLQTALTHIRAASATATMTGRETAAPAVPADAEVAGEKVPGSPAERRRWMARRHR